MSDIAIHHHMHVKRIHCQQGGGSAGRGATHKEPLSRRQRHCVRRPLPRRLQLVDIATRTLLIDNRQMSAHIIWIVSKFIMRRKMDAQFSGRENNAAESGEDERVRKCAPKNRNTQ